MNARLFILKLFIFCVFLIDSNAQAQNYFIKTDLLGYFYYSFPPDEIKPIYGNKYSLGFESRTTNPHLTYSILLNYGYPPAYGYTSSTYGIINGVIIRKGTFAFIDIRYYHLLKKTIDLNFYNEVQKGFFIGIYGGISNVTESGYSSFGTPSSYNPWKLDEQYNLWIYGIGGLVGYKQMIWKHFFVEGLLGIAYGKSNYNSVKGVSSDGIDLRYLDLWRIELSSGYAF